MTSRWMPPTRGVSRYAIALGFLGAGSLAQAQMTFERTPWTLTADGYTNLVAGHSYREDGGDAGGDSRVDAGLRLLALRSSTSGTTFGVRAEALSSPEDNLQTGERSVLAFGDWGRLEVGKRQGLPVTITGYAPNYFTFTGAEFSVSSGRGLDPGGTLATAFLSPSLAARIDAISTLGFATTLFNDQSGKLIYVAPKTNGWQFGASYSPDAEDQHGRFTDLTQAGLTREIYTGRNVYKFGGSVAHAQGGRDPVNNATLRDLNSLNTGFSATLDDALTLGVAFTYDGESGLASGPHQTDAHGVTASANYNTGPWTIGGYAQRAHSEGDPNLPGADVLRVLQFGVSYRISTQIRFFAATYFYRFDDEGGAAGRFDGTVVLGGVRLTL